ADGGAGVEGAKIIGRRLGHGVSTEPTKDVASVPTRTPAAEILYTLGAPWHVPAALRRRMPARLTKLPKLLAGALGVFGLAAAVAAACVNVDSPDVAFRCAPSQGDSACPDGYICCSDDAAALDGVAAAFPEFQ